MPQYIGTVLDVFDLPCHDNGVFSVMSLAETIQERVMHCDDLKDYQSTGAYLCLVNMIDEYLKNAIDAGGAQITLTYDMRSGKEIIFRIYDNAGCNDRLPSNIEPYDYFDAFLSRRSDKAGQTDQMGGRKLGLAIGAHFLEVHGGGYLSLSGWKGDGDRVGGAVVTLCSSLVNLSARSRYLRGEGHDCRKDFISLLIQVFEDDERKGRLVGNPMYRRCLAMFDRVEDGPVDLVLLKKDLMESYRVGSGISPGCSGCPSPAPGIAANDSMPTTPTSINQLLVSGRGALFAIPNADFLSDSFNPNSVVATPIAQAGQSFHQGRDIMPDFAEDGCAIESRVDTGRGDPQYVMDDGERDTSSNSHNDARELVASVLSQCVSRHSEGFDCWQDDQENSLESGSMRFGY